MSGDRSLDERIDELLAEPAPAPAPDFRWLAAGTASTYGGPVDDPGLRESTERYDGRYRDVPGLDEDEEVLRHERLDENEEMLRRAVWERYATWAQAWLGDGRPASAPEPPPSRWGRFVRGLARAVPTLGEDIAARRHGRRAAMQDRRPRPIDLLDQDQVWLPATADEPVALDAMGPRHKRHLLAYLRRQAPRLHNRWLWINFLTAPDEVAAEAEDQDPHEWLDQRPLVRRLVALIDADTAAGVPDESPPTEAELAAWRARNGIPDPETRP